MTTSRTSSVAGVVLFPGAGSDRTHSSLVAIEEALAPLPVFRVDFPYRRAGKRAPDRAPVLLDCVRTEVSAIADSLGVQTHQLVIGGRSMGGRMCSMAVADRDSPLEVAGLVLVSYPLHPPGKPEKLRTAHLGDIGAPVLCVSGTKDTFGTPEELRSAFAVVPTEVTWHWCENKRHELAGCDAIVADHVTQWIQNLG